MCCCCNGTIIELFVFWIGWGASWRRGGSYGCEMNRHEVDGRLWEFLVAIVTVLLNQLGISSWIAIRP